VRINTRLASRKVESAYKPGSVENSHSSTHAVTNVL